MAQYEDITIDQGADFSIDLKVINNDGSVRDLSGYSVNSQIRRTVNSSTAIDFTTEIKSDGIITLSLTNSQTTLLTPPRYFYDVEISYIDSDGQIFIERILYGNIEINPNITRV